MKTKILANLIYIFVRLINFTFRYKETNAELLEGVKSKTKNGNYIFGIWHQYLMGGILSQIGRKYIVIVSASKDNQLVATTCKKLSYTTARGSSHHRGKNAFHKISDLLRKGLPKTITINRPKDPAKVPKKDIFELALRNNIPVIPFLVYPEKFWSIEKSWDKFRIPKPFTTYYIRYGEPIYITEKDKENEYDNASKQLIDQLELCEKEVLDQYISNA